MAEKKASIGFRVIVAILVTFIITSLGVALGVYYWQNTQREKEKEDLTKQITQLEKEIKRLKEAAKNVPSRTPKTPKVDQYQGWLTYSNQTYKISIKYPPGWTYTEKERSLYVSIAGPETSGGVILKQCAFTIFVEDLSGPTSLSDYVDEAQSEPQGGGPVVEEGPTTLDDNAAYKVIDTYYEVGHNWKRMRVWTIKNNKAYTLGYRAPTNYNSTDYYSVHLSTAELMLQSIVID
jgi:hypothetical protein